MIIANTYKHFTQNSVQKKVRVMYFCDFNIGIVVGTRMAGLSISETADLLGFYTETCKEQKTLNDTETPC